MSETLYIDGRWRAAASGGTREIRCPADNSLVGVVAEGGAADTEQAIAAARRAFDAGEWSATPAADRGDLLLRVAAQIDERRDEFVRAETLDTGKRPYESDIDMTDIANCFRYFGKLAAADAGRVVDTGSPDADSRIVYEPVGVCGLITPWNYPLLQAAWKVAPALAAGNTFVLKPAELTPHTSILLMQVLEQVGLPAGVGNLVLGAGAEAGAPLSSHPDVDLVSFTGGLVTGRVIAREAAATVKKVALELGGKNPNVVFADACATDDLLAAAVDNALNAAFLHSGQVCSAGARLIIEESAHDRFVDELVRRAEQIRLGLPYSEGTETGPLISAAHRDKVHAYVEQARADGAIIRTGGAFATGDAGSGRLDDGWFYLPTVIDRADRSMACVHDEAFGPTVTVETFATEDEAVTLANDTVYGLAGAVWSADAARARRIAGRIRAGTVWVNDFGPYLPEAEWGGYGQSGFGRELGPSGLAEYREAKHVYENLRPGVTGWFADRSGDGEERR
ncbi:MULTISPECIES: aldehyde dehydrogenase family protein [unclassified Gordonia (in: high G+C Gram-positive bacteria)]|uniref:aldehyde dehydrogenase family protein n=1 Tax=unclassified Gordonia (in: high G+C Gram-positive bacteria) TaxID=2657482 RepID=UPI000990B492|nr:MULTISPECIES: aldehyde dehydrogenase family protein [unclassified Gordonia (in: high G+C Gram-positive bacteria)]MBR7192325.1 aldehyde dehydrogenase family protein [Gordonia sp. SCSIO 19800]MCX2755693.1 aldehyde dehydrogenase family protein [Gordonia sp. 4N]